MNEDKLFLTYNQQMRKLRNDKQIACNGSSDKKLLVRAGYFNIVNGYKLDECNENGKIPWYDTNAYSPNKSLQDKMSVISKAYSELSRSQLDYVKFYMDNHKQISTWIMIKVVNFSTFIDIIQCSKTDVSHSLCHLYGLEYEQDVLMSNY